MINPSWSKYGSYTSSNVLTSSPIDAATDDKPTGPPLNFSMIASKNLWSVSFNPSSSIFSFYKDSLVISYLMIP